MTEKKTTLSGNPPDPEYYHIEGSAAPQPIDSATGKHKDYWILTEQERSKGFIRPVRITYKHLACGNSTTMNRVIAETYARNPKFYGATFCAYCRQHLLVEEFIWSDGSKVGT
jgi:hypothetical protein